MLRRPPKGTLKVAFVIPYFYPAWQYGGQPRSAYELARALVCRGHDVTVLTTDSGGPSRLELSSNACRQVDGIHVTYYRNVSNQMAYRYRVFWPPVLFRELPAQLSGCELLHIHELRSTLSIAAYSAASRLSLPFVISTHGGLRHLGRRRLKLVFDVFWGRSMLRKANAIIAISPIEEAEARHMGVPESHIRYIPNAVSAADYQIAEPGTFRTRLGLKQQRVVLFLGRLHRIKGGDLAIRAFQKVAGSKEDVVLVIAGPDDGEERSLRQLVRKLKLTTRVVFTGFLDHSAKLQALTDCEFVVVPSRSEVFAISAIEALLVEKPVLLSSACGLHPLPGPDSGVMLFRSEDVDHLAKQMLVMLSDGRLRSNASAGREFVRREFQPSRMAEQAERIYGEILR